jgi:hypothetical protein
MPRHRDPQESFPTQELVELVESLQPELDPIYAAHCLTSAQAEAVLFESMTALGLRWHKIKDRRAWLLSRIERRCQALAAGENEEAAN